MDRIESDRIPQFYDNAHTPPSQKTAARLEVSRESDRSGASKARSRSEAARKAVGLCDQLQGRTDRQAGTQKRASCSGGNLIMARTTGKNSTGMPAMSRGIATCRMAEACGRSDRRSITMPETGLLGDASPAPNPTKVAAGMWKDKARYPWCHGHAFGSLRSRGLPQIHRPARAGQRGRSHRARGQFDKGSDGRQNDPGKHRRGSIFRTGRHLSETGGHGSRLRGRGDGGSGRF